MAREDGCYTNLNEPSALDATLMARASPRHDITILILGWTNGATQVSMREAGVEFVANQVESLRLHGITNTLAITTHLQIKNHGGNNLCLSALRPRGVCCGWSSVGMEHVPPHGTNDWGIFATHPYLLFLQRWWLTSHALMRGYNILSLDSDLHASVNPYELVRSPRLRGFDVLFQADSGWPILSGLYAGRHSSLYAGGARAPMRRAVDDRRRSDGDEGTGGGEVEISLCTAHHYDPCFCARTGAPMLNTGFVWARSANRRTAHLFNQTVHTILGRLGEPAHKDSRGKVHVARIWPQDVMNEVVFKQVCDGVEIRKWDWYVERAQGARPKWLACGEHKSAAGAPRNLREESVQVGVVVRQGVEGC